MSMRAARVETKFGLSELGVRRCDVPEPGPGEVRVRVRAASLNYRDLLVADGQYNPNYTLPLTIGSDAVGEIDALGDGAETFGAKLGARVCPLLAQGWLAGPPRRDTARFSLGGPLQGVFAEYAVVRADSVVEIPAYLTDAEAACLPCAVLTAWSALVTLSPIEPGQILFTVGSGGVSVSALQIAKLRGARVIATSRDASKRQRLERLGAEAVIDPQTAGWGDHVRKLAGGEGVDHVIEVGGATTLDQSFRAVRPGGTVSLIARFGRDELVPSLLPVVMRNLKVQGIYVGHRDSFVAMTSAFAAAEVRPVVDTVYPLEAVRDAFDHLASGRHFGKICLQIAAPCT